MKQGLEMRGVGGGYRECCDIRCRNANRVIGVPGRGCWRWRVSGRCGRRWVLGGSLGVLRALGGPQGGFGVKWLLGGWSQGELGPGGWWGLSRGCSGQSQALTSAGRPGQPEMLPAAVLGRAGSRKQRRGPSARPHRGREEPGAGRRRGTAAG